MAKKQILNLHLKEQEITAITEKQLMEKFGLSYSELQEIPMRIIKIWLEQDFEETEKLRFEEMIKKNLKYRL